MNRSYFATWTEAIEFFSSLPDACKSQQGEAGFCGLCYGIFEQDMRDGSGYIVLWHDAGVPSEATANV